MLNPSQTPLVPLLSDMNHSSKDHHLLQHQAQAAAAANLWNLLYIKTSLTPLPHHLKLITYSTLHQNWPVCPSFPISILRCHRTHNLVSHPRSFWFSVPALRTIFVYETPQLCFTFANNKQTSKQTYQYLIEYFSTLFSRFPAKKLSQICSLSHSLPPLISKILEKTPTYHSVPSSQLSQVNTKWE